MTELITTEPATKPSRPFTVFASLYDKLGLVEFLTEVRTTKPDLHIISSGGTADHLRKAGFQVQTVEELTGQKPILDGRVKTLVPQLYGGVLALDTPAHDADRAEFNIGWIDMSVHDFYPLEKEIEKPGSSEASVAKETDVGGPSYAHAAAKGRRLVLCKKSQWQEALERLRTGTADDPKYRRRLAATAEYEVAKYIMASARYLSEGGYEAIFGERIRTLRYGENASQAPAYQYATDSTDPLALHNFQLLEGNPSQNTITDLGRALQTVSHVAAVLKVNGHDVPIIGAGLKHGATCGQAIAPTTTLAIQNTLEGNLLAIFGGVFMTNSDFTEADAQTLLYYKMKEGERRLIDVVIAPSFSDGAIDLLRRAKDKCKVFANPALNVPTLDLARRFCYTRAGFVTQPNYTSVLDLKAPYVTRYGQATPEQELDMLLAWANCATTPSNTITFFKHRREVANAGGQQSRVESVELGLSKFKYSGEVPEGSAVVSDSFFPFGDGPQLLADHKVGCILTSSGSKHGDKATIDICQKHGIPLYMVPDEIFRCFFGHS
ncbi:MAG: hypothetical protein Q7R93_01735 [bacterium]|nr:hypothetical protein [bacterium]